MHESLYGHSIYTVRVCKAFPHLEALVIECAEDIRRKEAYIALEKSRLAAEAQKREEEATAEKVAVANAALADGTAPVAEEF